MMQKSTTFTTIFRLKKCYFHYDFQKKKKSMIKIFGNYCDPKRNVFGRIIMLFLS
jgi:hypothetical protein